MVIGVNVRNADIKQVVSKIQESLDKNVKLKPGYYFEYGGQFENLQNAIDTLTVVIPIALLLILLLLFFAFRSVIYSLVVFSTVPLSLIGGIVVLWLRGLPFSISAGVGFIALFGVAVLNGILMINHFNDLRKKNEYTMCTGSIIRHGCPHLLRHRSQCTRIYTPTEGFSSFWNNHSELLSDKQKPEKQKGDDGNATIED